MQASVNVDAERRITWHKPEHRSAYKFVVKDLHGGHLVKLLIVVMLMLQKSLLKQLIAL